MLRCVRHTLSQARWCSGGATQGLFEGSSSDFTKHVCYTNGCSLQDFLERTLKHLASKVPAVRKKAVATVGALAPVLSDALLEQAINALLGGMDKKSKSE
jgi:hypothetical protein